MRAESEELKLQSSSPHISIDWTLLNSAKAKLIKKQRNAMGQMHNWDAEKGNSTYIKHLCYSQF